MFRILYWVSFRAKKKRIFGDLNYSGQIKGSYGIVDSKYNKTLKNKHP